jgi:AraC family transcriptional regulator
MKPTSQSDYTKRIERVIAAVSASLEQEQALPSTAMLAGIANFSPFHFMRVYRALAGESLGATVQRLRLMRAAHLLAGSAAPISEIAGRVGFETPQAFARAFRQHFGLAPSEARAVDLANEVQSALPLQPPRQQPAIRVDVVTLNPFRVVVLRNQGAYAKLNEVYGRLYAWMAARGALESIGGIWGVPHHDGRDTPEEDCLFECCLATPAELSAADGVLPGDLGGGEFLRHLHLGSYERLDDIHESLLRELLARPDVKLRDAPILHEYLNDPEVTPESDLRTHIYLPVERSTDVSA